MKNIARLVATAALLGAAVLTVGGAAHADGGDIDWPAAPAPAAAPAPGQSAEQIDWP
ncbi:hypothetical protein ABZX75_29710 [Streptomyces sp. NPDC003038]|uniref:hypothetical protein n=1 Tax=unclassified Streptomyces TaxID=2593676 RepID=UPI0033A8B3FF